MSVRFGKEIQEVLRRGDGELSYHSSGRSRILTARAMLRYIMLWSRRAASYMAVETQSLCSFLNIS